MSPSFNAVNVYQAILGAATQPDRRNDLLTRVASGLMGNDKLAPEELRKGLNNALDSGLLSKEEAERLFPGMTNQVS